MCQDASARVALIASAFCRRLHTPEARVDSSDGIHRFTRACWHLACNHIWLQQSSAISITMSTAAGGSVSFLSPGAQASGTAAARLRNRQTNHPRQSSGVYNTFSHKQIQGFKEAFTMIDQDRDGLISREDLKVMLTNLGEWQVRLDECKRASRTKGS